VSPSTAMATCMELAIRAEPIMLAPFGNTVPAAHLVFSAASLLLPTDQIPTRE
jgi:hypothetical protein